MRMEESFSVDMEVPESVEVGDSYRVNVTVENTGDFPLRGVTVRIGDQVKRIDLDLTERVKVGFDIVAPEEEGVQGLKAEVYTDTMYGDVERDVRVEYSPLILREELRGDVLRIVADSDMVGGIIELEILKDGKTVYVDLMEVGDREHVVTLIPGNYLVRARVRKWDRVYEEKEMRTEVEKEFEVVNLNPFVMFPIALVDLALLGEVVRRRGYWSMAG